MKIFTDIHNYLRCKDHLEVMGIFKKSMDKNRYFYMQYYQSKKEYLALKEKITYTTYKYQTI